MEVDYMRLAFSPSRRIVLPHWYTIHAISYSVTLFWHHVKQFMPYSTINVSLRFNSVGDRTHNTQRLSGTAGTVTVIQLHSNCHFSITNIYIMYACVLGSLYVCGMLYILPHMAGLWVIQIYVIGCIYYSISACFGLIVLCIIYVCRMYRPTGLSRHKQAETSKHHVR